jgi:hypothetical protein
MPVSISVGVAIPFPEEIGEGDKVLVEAVLPIIAMST